MPLKLVPSGACEGASFLALSDHEVTATPHAGTTFAIRSTGATKSRACHGATGYDVGTACKKAASQTPHQTQTVLHECTLHERRAGAGPREIAQKTELH